MRKYINKMVLTLVLVLSLLLAVGCGGNGNKTEKTELEKALEANYEGVKGADLTSSIKLGEIELYKETTKYEKTNSGFKVTSTVKKLNGLDKDEEYSETTTEKEENKCYTVELKADYLEDANASDGKLEAKLTSQGVKNLIDEDASNASIVVNYSDGLINSVTLTYGMNGQSVTVSVRFNY